MVQIRSDSPRGSERLDVILLKTAHQQRYGVCRTSVRTTCTVLAVASALGLTYHFTTSTISTSLTSSALVSTSPFRSSTSTASKDECRFYLAESAIPRSGLGLFTAIELQPGDQAQSMPDICLYVADTPTKTHFETHSWAKDVFLGLFEGANPRGACEGFATLFNSMPPGVQTSKLELRSTHDNAGLHRSDDAGAGAVSHYYGVSSVATRQVKAGSELTIDYGDWPYDERKTYTAPERTVPWLREHGMCIDNIRIQPATDARMGRGAFAARKLAKGTAVSPAPLQFFPDRESFARQAVGPEPLFINYCLSIGDTNMLLFPYGPGVNLINHASSRSKKKPNVELQWSTHGMNHATWLDLPLSQLRQMDYPGGLLLNVVALRDLQAGEELLMDYGNAWEAAWEEHVRTWTPDPSASSYVYPQDIDTTQPFRTVSEQEKDPYPSNMATVCWTANWERDTNTVMAWTQPTFDWPEGITYCNIHERTKTVDGHYEYEVSYNFDLMRPDRKDRREYIDTKVPHSAIWLVDKPYQSDMHLPNAFRHPIALPEHLVPPSWLVTDEVPMASKKQGRSVKKSKRRKNKKP